MYKFFKLCLLVQVLFLGTPVLAQEKLTFSTIEKSAVAAVATDIILEAYKKLGIEIEVYPTSGKRSLVLSSKGSYDGEVVRIYAVGDKFPDLKRVELSGFILKAVVLINRKNLNYLSIDTLKTKQVGHLEGVVQAERFTNGFMNVWEAGTNEELFELLAAERLEAVISTSVAEELMIKKLGLDNVVQLGPPFEVEQFYHYLHKKNEHLIPKIQAVLHDMHASGETGAIMAATMARLAMKLEIKTSNLPD